MTLKEKRLFLFDRYNKNWQLVKAHVKPTLDECFHDAVMCPGCGIFYLRSFLDEKKKNHWTIEDVPPKKIGGKGLILTCKNCNNKAGHGIDVALIDYLKTKPFLNMDVGSQMYLPKTTIHYKGGKIVSSAILKLAGVNTLHFKLNLKKGEHRYSQFHQIDKGDLLEGQFHFHTPSLRFVQIALLKIAYHQLFHKFGHAFSFNKNYDLIRSQILNPTADLLPSFGVMEPNLVTTSAGVYVFNELENLKSFIVVFDLLLETTITKNVVFFPSPFLDPIKFYQDFKQLEKFKFKCNEHFLNHDFLTDPKWVVKWLNVFSK